MYIFPAFNNFVFTFADFSNVISKQDVKVLAEADDQEVVREIQVSRWSKPVSLCGPTIEMSVSEK